MSRLTNNSNCCEQCIKCSLGKLDKIFGGAYCIENFGEPCIEKNIYNKLKDYEDLEEQGKLVLFPRYAYFVKDNKVYKGWVQEVVYSVCRKPLYDIRYDDNSIASYRGYLGNKVFLTKEEAEKALERLECAE